MDKKEIFQIIAVSILFGFLISLVETTKLLLLATIFSFIVIMINLVAKKLTADYFESKIETKIWEISRWGFKPWKKFKKPVPAGVIFPLVSKVFLVPLTGFVWLASLTFDAKPEIYRAAKRHGFYSFTEIQESHLGYIASMGILANLVFAIIGYLINQPLFAEINIYYAFSNIIPISNLDGNKIFFGNIILWSFLAAVTFIGLFAVVFVA